MGVQTGIDIPRQFDTVAFCHGNGFADPSPDANAFTNDLEAHTYRLANGNQYTHKPGKIYTDRGPNPGPSWRDADGDRKANCHAH